MGDNGVSIDEGVVVEDDFSLNVGEEHCSDGDKVAAAGENEFESIVSFVREVYFNAGEVRAV